MESILSDTEELRFTTQIENLAALPAFDELLETAIDTCLSSPKSFEIALENVKAKTLIIDEHKTAQQLGLWGLRGASDYESNSSTFMALEEIPDAMRMEDLVGNSDLIIGKPDITVQQKIEAFGQALIDEAFACLGEDAPQKAAEFQDAETYKEKAKIINWLIGRIEAIKHSQIREEEVETVCEIDDLSERDEWIQLGPPQPADRPISGTITVNLSEEVIETNPDLDNKYFYHPLRLSPKLIGVYPDIKVRPTCLSISLLASAFFEKAQAPYLHAGVLMSALERGRLAQLISIASIEDYAEKYEITLPDEVNQKLDSIHDAAYLRWEIDRGNHAAILVRMTPNTWMQFDPNYSSNCILGAHNAKAVEDCYEKIQDFEKVIAGSEHLLVINGGYIGTVHETIAHELLLDIKESSDPGQIIAEACLAEDPLETFKDYFLQFLTEDPELDVVTDDLMDVLSNDKIDYIDKLLEDIIFTYVFAGSNEQDLKKCLQRCHTDEAYLRRRTEDVRMAPMYVLLKMQGEFINALAKHTPSFEDPHLAMEVGAPGYRLGACVLSDFAVYTGGDLPFSFWLANFPSYVVFTDHIPSKDEDLQMKLAKNLAEVIDSSSLRYPNSHVIVNKFLEREGEEQHG